jgi:mRNA-degrading endonuclease RelE of RelBE toxin-antitoxin system
MKKYEIGYTDNFIKDLNKLSTQEQLLVLKTIDIMEENPYYQSLRTKKMNGRRKYQRELFKSRVNRDIRLIWYFDDDNDKIIVMLEVGHHDVEKQRKIQRH